MSSNVNDRGDLKNKRGHAIFLGGHVRVEEVRDGRFILKYGTIPCFKGTGGVASWVLRLRCFRRLFVSQEEAVVPPLDILAEQNLHSALVRRYASSRSAPSVGEHYGVR